jgi:hypothetical protein
MASELDRKEGSSAEISQVEEPDYHTQRRRRGAAGKNSLHVMAVTEKIEV